MIKSSMQMYSRNWRKGEASVPDKSLRVMQFNILADGLSGLRPDKGLFDRVPVECLEWSFRKKRLLEEILCYDPDIVCCQEVDHFEDFLQPFGYRGIFAPKPSSPCLQVSSKPDGCAIFFKEGVVLTHSSVLSFKNQNQISLIGVFEWNSKQMIVATTHLKAQKDQNGESIRVAETQELLAYLESKYATLPIIIAADLNATPTPSSDYPSLVYPIFQQNQYQSAYATILGQELSYSTWKSRYGQDPIKHTIDYIWCNREWQIHGCLDVPQVLDQQLIPSYRYGSDHFALLTEISYLN